MAFSVSVLLTSLLALWLFQELVLSTMLIQARETRQSYLSTKSTRSARAAYLLTVEELGDRLAVMLGGRAAEKIVFDTISTGASDDIQRATELARRMVTEFGMSEKLGSVRYAGPQLQYLGTAVAEAGHLSPHTQDVIDAEVQHIIDAQYERAQRLLIEHRSALVSLMERLLTTETLDGSVVRQALNSTSAAA
jgi:cell division protease FtsH